MDIGICRNYSTAALVRGKGKKGEGEKKGKKSKSNLTLPYINKMMKLFGCYVSDFDVYKAII